MKRILLFAATLIVAACQPAAPPITQEDVSDKAFDILLTGGTVVDGLGTPRYQADVGIKGDRIVAISTDGLSAEPERLARLIEAKRHQYRCPKFGADVFPDRQFSRRSSNCKRCLEPDLQDCSAMTEIDGHSQIMAG